MEGINKICRQRDQVVVRLKLKSFADMKKALCLANARTFISTRTQAHNMEPKGHTYTIKERYAHTSICVNPNGKKLRRFISKIMLEVCFIRL